MHERRYAVLLETVRRLVPPQPRLLDVGAAHETTMLRELPGATVDTLGFDDARFPPREGERHIPFDLKDAERPESWPELEPYDLVVCAEVIEHVPVAPQHVVRFIAGALRPGGWLVLQTPNAARIANRVRLLAGSNPFEPLREDSARAGHFREYTVDELLTLGRKGGLELGGWLTANYFDTGTRANALLRRLGPLVPRRLRAGVTVWLRKPASTLTA
jgi:SAM-dependent methyltransferase